MTRGQRRRADRQNRRCEELACNQKPACGAPSINLSMSGGGCCGFGGFSLNIG